MSTNLSDKLRAPSSGQKYGLKANAVGPPKYWHLSTIFHGVIPRKSYYEISQP